MNKSVSAIVARLVILLSCAAAGYGQSNSGSIKGTVLDPSGAAVSGAAVTILNAVSQYTRTAQSDVQGNFEFANIPFNNYHLTVTEADFSQSTRM